MGDVVRELDNVDAPDVLSRAAASPALATALEIARPRNWWGIGIHGPRLLALSREFGIPLAWVPRLDVVRELAAAADRQQIDDVLRRRTADIVDDCAAVIDECEDDWIAGDVVLTRRAIEALLAGHHEAAMALAVSLGEQLADWASQPRVRAWESRAEREAWERRLRNTSHYRWAELELAANPTDGRFNFIQNLLMAPIPSFFAPFRRESGLPAPPALSRHVVAHQPTPAHFSVTNALVAIMLVSSILRQQQDWCEEVRSADARFASEEEDVLAP